MTGFRYRWPSSLGAALPLLLVLALPELAQAECGDYVRIGKGGAHQPMPQESKSPAAPCDGPACSERRSPLAPPPATTQFSLDDQRFCTFQKPILQPAHDAGWTIPANRGSTITSATDIFHPPR